MCSYLGYFKIILRYFGHIFQLCCAGADVKYFSQIWLSGGRKHWWGSRQESRGPVLAGLWGFGQSRLWRKERSEDKDEQEPEVLWRCSVLPKIDSVLSYERPRAKGFRSVFFFFEQDFIFLGRWDERITAVFFFFFF